MFNFEEMITKATLRYADKVVSNTGVEYYAITRSGRKLFLAALVAAARSQGKEKEFFSLQRTKQAIADACFPPTMMDKRLRSNGYQAVYRELAEVVSDQFPNE